jgi:proline iminopeptidase
VAPSKTFALEQEKFIDVDEGKIYCKIIGQGNPVLVIHGGAGAITHDNLLPYFEQLAQENTVIFYDQRGLGRSVAKISDTTINLKSYIEDIEKIRLDLGFDKISLIGHSWGGFLAMNYAMDYPKSIDKLILLSSMPASSDDLQSFFDELKIRFAPIQEKMQSIQNSEEYLSGNPEAVKNYLQLIFKTYLYNAKDIEKINFQSTKEANLNGFQVTKIFGESIFSKPYNNFQELSQLKCPTLVLHGDVDPIPFSTAVHIHEAIPSSKLVKIENCGHFPFVEKTAFCFDEIKQFLGNGKER